MREGISKFNAGDRVHLNGIVEVDGALNYRVGHGKILCVRMQDTRPYVIQLEDSTGKWCAASEADLSLILRPDGREVPEIPVGSRVYVCGVGLDEKYIDAYGVLDSTGLTNFPYGVRFESGHLVWFPKHAVSPVETCDEPLREKTERDAEFQVGARVMVCGKSNIFSELADTPAGEEAKRCLQCKVSDVSGTCAHDKPGRGTKMLSVGTRVKVKGVSIAGDSCEDYGEITMTDNTVYPYGVRTDSGLHAWFLASAVRAVEKEDTQGGTKMNASPRDVQWPVLLGVGTRVLVHGSSAHINQLEGPGVIIASEISATPYKVQMNDGAQHWLPASAVCLGVPQPAEDKAREFRTLNRGKEDSL